VAGCEEFSEKMRIPGGSLGVGKGDLRYPLARAQVYDPQDRLTIDDWCQAGERKAESEKRKTIT